jgi:hypothetical protein
MAATYDVGTKAWQPDVTEGWVASEVEQKNLNGDKVTLVFQLANGEVSPPQELLLHKSRRWLFAADKVNRDDRGRHRRRQRPKTAAAHESDNVGGLW